MDPNPDTTVLHDENYEPIDSITVGGVVRLCVQAVLAAGGPLVTDADDNAVAQGQTLLASIPLNYIHNGAGWIRQQGGTDNVATGGANQGTFVAGVARAALAAYADGDVALPTFDLAGRLMVNMGAIAVEDDDDSVAAGATHETVIPLTYGYDGSVWRRVRVKSAAAATSDERLMHLSTMSVLALIDTTAPAGSMEIPIAADRNVGAVATETGYYVPTRSSVMGYDASQAAGSRSVPVAARNADVAGDFAAALIGLVTNSRCAAWNPDTNDYELLQVERWDQFEDQTNTWPALLTGALSLGLNSFSGDLQIIESRAAVTAQAYTLNRLLADSVVRGDDGTTYSAVAARNFDAAADVAKTLIGLLVNARLAYYDNGTNDWAIWSGDLASAVSGRSTGGVGGVYVNAITVGLDNTGAAVLRPVEARSISNFANVDTTNIISLFTQAMISGRQIGTAVNRQTTCDRLDSFLGTAITGAYGLLCHSPALGVDNTGAAAFRAVEARNFDVAADAVSTLIGLLVNSRGAYWDIGANDWRPVGGTSHQSITGSVAELMYGPYCYSANADEYAAARRGKRFYATHQTPGTLITAQTSFVATTPTFMYRINSAAIRAIVRSFNLSIQNTPGGPVFVCLAIDTADRYDSAGTAVTLQNSNEESATAAVGLFYTNPTANAAGAGTRYLNTWVIPASVGGNMNIDLGDGVLLGPGTTPNGSTLLIYVWAASTAPDLTFGLDIEEVA